MRLYIFENTLVKIISGALIALTLFAILAGQSAHAGQFSAGPIEDETQLIAGLEDNDFTRALTLVAELEDNFLSAGEQMIQIDEDYKNGKVSEEDLFIATVAYFNIEDALNDARSNLTAVILEMQRDNADALDDQSRQSFAFTRNKTAF